MKLLILTSRFPYPINKGDKLRAYHQIKELSKQFEIHLISISDQKMNSQELKELESYCKTIKILYLPIWKRGLNLLRTFLNNKPFQVNYFYSTRFQKIINSIIKEVAPDHIYCPRNTTIILGYWSSGWSSRARFSSSTLCSPGCSSNCSSSYYTKCSGNYSPCPTVSCRSI